MRFAALHALCPVQSTEAFRRQIDLIEPRAHCLAGASRGQNGELEARGVTPSLARSSAMNAGRS